jgi:hypothetical protein
MLIGTYDSLHGLLRAGDEKNVPEQVATRWQTRHIAIIIDQPETKATFVPIVAPQPEEVETIAEPEIDVPEIAIEAEVVDLGQEEQSKTVLGYDAMTRAELEEIAEQRGIKITKAMKLETIIRKLGE